MTFFNQLLKILVRLVGVVRYAAFESLYYPLAPFYDRISSTLFLGQWTRWQQAALPRIQGKRVLEVGCGTGSLLSEMLRRGYKAYGVDYSMPMLRQAQRKIEAANFRSRLIRANVKALPFPDESFETVISTFPTNYILSLDALNEINRVLYPGGRLVIVDNAELRPFNRAAKLLLLFQRLVYFGSRPRSGRDDFSASSLNIPLEKASFLRRDETAEDKYGAAHVIIAIKVW